MRPERWIARPTHLFKRLGQLHSPGNRILLPNLIRTSTAIMRLLDIDHLVNVALDIVGSHVDPGEGHLGFVEGYTRLFVQLWIRCHT